MPVLRSRGAPIDNTKIEQGLSSIAQIFAPPSAQEAYALAKAKSENANASRISELYGMAGEANVDQSRLDRLAGIAGAYTPNQSLTAVGMNNRTSLATNAADNARQLQQTTMTQQGETDRTLLAPVAQGATRFVPPTIASAYSLPPTQTGVIESKPGERSTLPDGRVIAGAPKPLSMDEVRAATFTTLPPEQQAAITFGATPLQTIQTDGGQRLTTGPQAIGQAPAPDTAKTDLRNYKDGDRSGAAKFDPAQGWVDAQTGQKLSPNVQTYSSQLQGNADETGLGTTAKNSIEQQLADAASVEQTGKTLRGLIERDPNAQGIVGTVLGIGQDTASVIKEGGKLFGPLLSQTQQDIAKGLVDPEIAAQVQTYNPNIPQVKLQEMLLAGQVAKMIDPNGRISNERMQQVTAALGGGGFLSNRNRTIATLDAIQGMVDQKRQMFGKTAPAAAALGGTTPSAGSPVVPDRAPPAPTQTGTPTPDAPVQRWGRGPDGKPVRLN